MDITVLNQSFIRLHTIDIIDSFIWTEKYNEVGEFELYAKFSPSLLSMVPIGYYLSIPVSEKLMIIETVRIKSDPENGDKLVIKGRSLESVLDRRIVLRPIGIDMTLQNGIEFILNTQVINGQFPERNFPNFVFSASTDPLVTTPLLEAKYYTENVLEVIQLLTKQHDLGFKVILNPATNQSVFSLYAGADRSYNQSTNSFVVFSPNFDNLLNSEYLETKLFYKNFVLVSCDLDYDLGQQPVAQVWSDDVGTGYDRLEMFSDARQIQWWDPVTGDPYPVEDTQAQLFQRGREELARNSRITNFDANVDLNNTFTYREDFFLGDIIQTEDNYGHSARVRVVGITFSENLQGSSIYPILQTV